MANTDSNSQNIRFNLVSQQLEFALGTEWDIVPGVGTSITAGEIDSTPSADNTVLTSDGLGGTAWEVIPIQSTPPAGTNGQLQFNNSNAFGATAAMVWDGTTLTIGGGLADPSAIFMAATGTQGVIFPRMNNTQRDAINNPAEGLTIYNTQVHAIQYYNGTVWLELEVNPV